MFTRSGRRHLLIIASQCREMRRLDSLEQAAGDLRAIMLDDAIGACVPALANEVSLISGEVPRVQIEDAIREAVRNAAARGATLVLALLGHGFTPGNAADVYFMAGESTEDDVMGAVDVKRLLQAAADTVGVEGVVAILDMCGAGGAQPAQPTVGVREGQVALSLLMAAGVGREAYDLSLSRNLTAVLRRGVEGAGPYLLAQTVLDEVKQAPLGQIPLASSFDGLSGPSRMWLAYNRAHARWRGGSVGALGATAVTAAAAALLPAWQEPTRWDAEVLTRFKTDLQGVPDSPARIRAERTLDGLSVSAKTVGFLRAFMAPMLTSTRLRRALASLSWTVGRKNADLTTLTDFVEMVALCYPSTHGSCRKAMTQFVTALLVDAQLDPEAGDVRRWADAIDATTQFNDALEASRQRTAEKLLRLVVSLHGSTAGAWPETLQAWLLHGQTRYDYMELPCQDRPGAENGLREAVAWADDHARDLGIRLRRIEVALPSGLLLQWQPEEVEYGVQLGMEYDVLVRWSERISPPASLKWINSYAARRLAEMESIVEGSPLRWLTKHEVDEVKRLCEALKFGRLPGALGLVEHPGNNNQLLDLLLPFAPILLWPRKNPLSDDQRRSVADRWGELPEGLLLAYRHHWKSGDYDPCAEVRAVWDDQEWLDFCHQLRSSSENEARSRT